MTTWLTEYTDADGRTWCGRDILAADWHEAEWIAYLRGRGEIVVGELVGVIPM